jgi:uncharacterized lipoprotein YmbA
MKPLLVLFAAATVVTACSSPKTTYYTLSAPPVTATTAMTHNTRIVVGPVTVPSLVDTPQLVVKNSNNQVTVYEYQRWAGSLKSDIERVVAADLSRDLGTPNVWSYTQSAFAQFDYQILIDVQNIDSKLGDSVTIDVLWTIKPTAAKEKTHTASKQQSVKSQPETGSHPASYTGRAVITEAVSGAGFDALVAAQSRAFDRLSADIAKSIRAH